MIAGLLAALGRCRPLRSALCLGLAVAAILWLVVKLVSLVPVVVVPVLVALLLTALLTPLRDRLESLRLPRGLAVLVSILTLLLALAGLITLVVVQARAGFGVERHVLGR